MLPWLPPLALLPVLLLWVWIWLNPRRRRSLRYLRETETRVDTGRTLPDARLPPVAILSPGRNEAEHLEALLPALLEQDYPDHRVIFIDDGSDDGTEAVTARLAARDPNLLVFRNEVPPPRGWVGKCWALHRGMEHLAALERAEGRRYPLVCFTDADVHWDRQCLRRAVTHQAETGADVLGILPHLKFGSTPERLALSAMVMAIGVVLPLEKAMDPRSPRTLLSGAFILARRSLYEAIGGHGAVRDRIIDDIGLGEAMKAAGGRVRLTATRSLVTCRMYEDWPDLWEGLTKNAYAGLGYGPLLAGGFMLATLLANIGPPFYLVAAIIWGLAGGGLPAWLTAAGAAGVLLVQVRVAGAATRVLELPARYRLSLPVSSALYLALIAGSIWRHYRGGNTWKGRHYRHGEVG